MYYQYTYFLRFFHRDSFEIEEYEHRNEEEAREHFEMFDDTDAEYYTHIDLFVYDWKAQTETHLDSKLLNLPV